MSVRVLASADEASDKPEVILSHPVVLRFGPMRLRLEQRCTGCGGAGYVPVVVEEPCTSCLASGFEDVATQLVCGVCEGYRVRPVEEMEPCRRCDETGIELTELGRRFLSEAGPELLIFLSRWRGWRLG